MTNIATTVKEQFHRHFKGEPIIVRSPGRVNIIGEHTDYNEGFVLPAAIDKAIFVAAAARADKRIALYSVEFNQHFEIGLDELKPVPESWPNYIIGVAAQLQKKGYTISGFNLAILGDVPIGSGLSSSAAVECATVRALVTIFNLEISEMDQAFIAQKAEHEFAGVLCGIMDQFASVFGKKDHVIRLDCRSLEYEYVPLKMEGFRILLLNTNVKHALGDTEYNTRRAQCEEGVALVRAHHPEVKSLRDVTLQQLAQYVQPKDGLIYRRCRYVVEENERLLGGCEDLKAGRVDDLGQKMFASHRGLSRDYEVSCPELDFLVDAVRSHPGVIGARMMGGGFGGCTINLVREDAIQDMIPELSAAYHDAMGKALTPYIASIQDGTTILER